ncbi:unnamed protein product [Boreogadus saida]
MDAQRTAAAEAEQQDKEASTLPAHMSGYQEQSHDKRSHIGLHSSTTSDASSPCQPARRLCGLQSLPHLPPDRSSLRCTVAALTPEYRQLLMQAGRQVLILKL